jgi:hypothetical protein
MAVPVAFREKGMNGSKFVIMAALAVMGHSTWAQPQTNVEAMTAPGQASVTGTTKVTATVVGIEADTRTVWLKTPQGKTVQVVVGEDARNFDQLKVGDIVNAQYTQAVTLSLRKERVPLSSQESESMERSIPGAKPGGTVGRKVTLVADVVAVNAKTKMVTLKGPEGKTLDLMVEDPDQLNRVKKGDQVHVVYTESMAISVEPAASK